MSLLSLLVSAGAFFKASEAADSAELLATQIQPPVGASRSQLLTLASMSLGGRSPEMNNSPWAEEVADRAVSLHRELVKRGWYKEEEKSPLEIEKEP